MASARDDRLPSHPDTRAPVALVKYTGPRTRKYRNAAKALTPQLLDILHRQNLVLQNLIRTGDRDLSPEDMKNILEVCQCSITKLRDAI